jgi:hypothetical protein
MWSGTAGRLALVLAVPCLFCLALGCISPQTARLQVAEDDDNEPDIKSVETIGAVTTVANASPVAISGVGLVTGLEGTGGSPPPCYFRSLLEQDLRKHQVKNIKEVLANRDNAMVLVSALIPAGARKGDPLDIEVVLPGNTKATSLRGGYLQLCSLMDYNTTKNLKPDTTKPDSLLRGHVLARARGPVLTGFSDDDKGLHVGRIWEGGASLIDRPFYLVLKNDQQFARIANAVAQHINSMYPDDPEQQQKVLQQRRLLLLQRMTDQINESFTVEKQRAPLLGSREVAKPLNKEVIYVNVPWQYRLNPERYLRVVRLMPLRETAEQHARYCARLQTMLLDPAKCLRAALRLEALGRSSVPALKEALKSSHPFVRFCAGEALTYLGNPVAADELGSLARRFEPLRAYCLLALASLDEVACREKLAELLESPIPELRYGAFRALRLLDESDPHVHGTLLGESFWVHQVEPESSPLVHYTLGQRAEVVLFGRGQRLLPPVDVRAQEFTVRADEGDDRCIIKRFMAKAGRIEQRLCSLQVADVLKTLAELGAQYPDVVGVLRSLGEEKAVSCPVRMNALPALLPAQDLVTLGRNPAAWQGPTSERDAAAPEHTALPTAP